MNKALLRYFLLLSAVFLIVFNFGYVDWFFNYKTVKENLGYLIRKAFGQNEVSVFFSEIALLSLPNQASSSVQSQNQITQKKPVFNPNQKSYISIPAIDVYAPISFTQSKSQNVFSSLLNVGVLHYPDSALPGEKGTSIILGHSAPPNWPKIRYDSVFNNLQNLKLGSEVLIDYQGQVYKYTVKNTFFVKAGQDLSPFLTFDRSMLLLVSCWPPGKNLQRIVVEAELKIN